ncbi:uncharacterized protein LOC110656822 isoform X3 [Hevea brasiliensis]|uniref:uncharacterized protein LOC110656822 isoform X3 n=1 Tax=Hevea brasiliensis TaxID=3981 RepID=UPI0025F18C00|nr:uncharacterized protein LOC110656822 isoform X3 [Hevea brasiliensis]
MMDAMLLPNLRQTDIIYYKEVRFLWAEWTSYPYGLAFARKKQLVHMLKQDIPGVSWTNNASYLRMFSSKYRAQFHIQTPFCL